jgi:predicted dehydrogenase
MPKLSIGVIGAGAIGNFHLTGYANAKRDVTIAAICDTNQARLDEMGEKFGVAPEHRYRDYQKMLASENLDAVSVCVPNKFHFEVAAAVIQRDINLLLEKPVVLTLVEARKLRQLLKKHPIKFMVAFSHRFFYANIAAKKLLQKGAIGQPYSIRVRYAHTGPYPGWAQSDWFYKKSIAGAGAMLDMGIHAIDMCQNLIGPVETVQAEVKTLRKKIQVDDNAVMLLDFGKNAACLGTIEVGWTSPAGFAGIEIFGDKGSISLPLGQHGLVTRGVRSPDGKQTMRVEEIKEFNGNEHWRNQMEQWVRYISGKKPTTHIPGWPEGESALAVALAAEESSKTGRRVKVKQPK